MIGSESASAFETDMLPHDAVQRRMGAVQSSYSYTNECDMIDDGDPHQRGWPTFRNERHFDFEMNDTNYFVYFNG